LKLFINSNIKQHTSTGSLGFIEAVHQQQYKAAYQCGKALVLLKLFINSNIKQPTSVGRDVDGEPLVEGHRSRRGF